MKRVFLLAIFMGLFSHPASAQYGAANSQSANAQETNKNGQKSYDQNLDKEDSDDFYNELIYQDYGSNQSADFNNTEEMNPNEANYGYGAN